MKTFTQYLENIGGFNGDINVGSAKVFLKNHTLNIESPLGSISLELTPYQIQNFLDEFQPGASIEPTSMHPLAKKLFHGT